MPILQKRARSQKHVLFWAVLMASVAASPMAAQAEALVPMTRLKLTVVQFVTSLGEYRNWDALGGEFDVAADGSINVPSLGPISIANMSADQLGSEIATRLQTKLGLLEKPDATVQVVQYPPVYVAGDVTTPGEFAYRPGMSVIQALAMAGGERRMDMERGLSETIRLETDLLGYESDIVRLQARLARLKAEFTQESAIEFPVVLDPLDPVIAEILEQEKRIFAAHGNEMARQKTGLIDLDALYEAEIDALGQKLAAVDEQITRTEQQVVSIRELVAKGSATASRLSDIERELANLRSERLDIVISTMTARENLNHSQRELAKIEDEQQSETSRSLQEEQGKLEKILQQQAATRRMLVKSVETDNNLVLAGQIQTTLAYAIVRQKGEEVITLSATETSQLQPGDLIKVTLVEASARPSDTAMAPAQ